MTTRDVFWFLFLFIPLTIIWVLALLDMMRRPDLVGWQKAIWALVIIFFPWIGVFAYLLLRPRDVTAVAPSTASATTTAPARTPQAAPTAVPTTVAGDRQEAMS